MLKQIYSLLNIAILTIVVLTLGSSALTVYQHIMYAPSDMELPTSAPWYLGIVVNVIFALVPLIILLIARFFVGRKVKKLNEFDDEEG